MLYADGHLYVHWESGRVSLVRSKPRRIPRKRQLHAAKSAGTSSRPQGDGLGLPGRRQRPSLYPRSRHALVLRHPGFQLARISHRTAWRDVARGPQACRAGTPAGTCAAHPAPKIELTLCSPRRSKPETSERCRLLDWRRRKLFQTGVERSLDAASLGARATSGTEARPSHFFSRTQISVSLLRA